MKTLQSLSFDEEAITLATLQGNECAYCLSEHTSIGKMNGFTEEGTLEIRTNSIADQKLNTLVSLESDIIERKGHPSEKAVQSFLNTGYRKAAFTELIGAVALTTIINYVFHNGDFEIDFPKAQEIENVLTTSY